MSGGLSAYMYNKGDVQIVHANCTSKRALMELLLSGRGLTLDGNVIVWGSNEVVWGLPIIVWEEDSTKGTSKDYRDAIDIFFDRFGEVKIIQEM
jgi:hypothetical protein